MTLHAALVRAVRDFNSGRYFEAHEHLEEALEEVEGDQRWELFLALIQVAVGYHKRASGHPGAEKMLGLALEKLSALPDVCAGVRVAELRRRIGSDLAAPGRLSERLAEDPPRIRLVRGASA